MKNKQVDFSPKKFCSDFFCTFPKRLNVKTSPELVELSNLFAVNANIAENKYFEPKMDLGSKKSFDIGVLSLRLFYPQHPFSPSKISPARTVVVAQLV